MSVESKRGNAQSQVELGQLAPQLAGAVWRSQLPATVKRKLAAVEQADVLVLATPVYCGSHSAKPSLIEEMAAA